MVPCGTLVSYKNLYVNIESICVVWNSKGVIRIKVLISICSNMIVR